jgi:hypothetical protein
MAATDLSALWLRMASVSALYLAFFASLRLRVKSVDLWFFNRLLETWIINLA